MCYRCGHFWLVLQYGPRLFAVMHEHPNGGRTEIEKFKTELEAVLLANQLHHEKLLQHNLFGKFKECAEAV